MAQVRQGMIQRLEEYTSRLKENDQDTILRLHKGQIKKGAYKGTWSRHFTHFIVRIFSRKVGEQYNKYLDEVTQKESRALASALCKDISRRTPMIYKSDQTINTRGVKHLLEESARERQQFDKMLNEFVAIATTSIQRHDLRETTGQYLNRHLTEKGIAHYDQMQFLRTSALRQLKQKSSSKKHQPPEKRLKRAHHCRAVIEQVIDEKMLTLAFFNEAEQYALRNMTECSDISPNKSQESVEPEDHIHQRKVDKIDQTINTLKVKYPELAQEHAMDDVAMITAFLERQIDDRTISHARPFSFVREPLKEMNASLISQFSATPGSKPDQPTFDVAGISGIKSKENLSDETLDDSGTGER